ncbi:cache domain-containing protein [Desulfopila aestuarii]|uniref:histidine kinase n=1 Tax=Desulfopila aestuarii DSM 18488 TaxID=1121416 RepID=A0A1M7YE82_9BACT|nr:cache domain-containing protein [Desulfopila aestuarii]SHO50954.1 PAS domain S-box-containing protein [Desulfopila aestuarii DSM 18488]
MRLPGRNKRRPLPKIIPVKIILPVLLSMFLFIATFFGFILPRIEGQLMERKREMIHALSEAALSSVKHYANIAASGTMTVEEAKQQAAEHLRDLRYGPEGKDYFWINDTHPYMIMHPYRPDLEGKDVTEETDPAGQKLFQDFLEAVKVTGGGYVNYHWQWQDDPSRVFSKISYVQEFAPWHWIIGTGVYVEDVHAQINAITKNMTFIFLIILLVIAMLSVYIIWQGASVENRRRQMEVSLRKSENRYRLLTETAREMILVLDKDLRITYANTAFTKNCGYPLATIIDASITRILPSEQQMIFFNKIDAVSSDASDSSMLETEFIADDNRIMPVEANFALLDGQGGPLTFLLTARDITDKKRAEIEARMRQEQLMQTNKMVALGTLVAGVAHEINNPISSVMLNFQVYERFWQTAQPILDSYHAENGHLEIGGMDYPQLRERMPKLLHFTREGVSRVKRIVGELKEFSRQNPAELREAVNLNQVVETSIGLLTGLLKKATTDLRVELDENLPTLPGNSQRLGQVIINLLVNACQATDNPSKPIIVTTSYLEESEEVLLEIIDQGVGMTPDVLERVKDPFFTTRRDSSGTGLGLSISDTIIRNHRGWLNFKSEPGLGTTATVRLPRYDMNEIIGRMI